MLDVCSCPLVRAGRRTSDRAGRGTHEHAVGGSGRELVRRRPRSERARRPGLVVDRPLTRQRRIGRAKVTAQLALNASGNPAEHVMRVRVQGGSLHHRGRAIADRAPEAAHPDRVHGPHAGSVQPVCHLRVTCRPPQRESGPMTSQSQRAGFCVGAVTARWAPRRRIAARLSLGSADAGPGTRAGSGRSRSPPRRAVSPFGLAASAARSCPAAGAAGPRPPGLAPPPSTATSGRSTPRLAVIRRGGASAPGRRCAILQTSANAQTREPSSSQSGYLRALAGTPQAEEVRPAGDAGQSSKAAVAERTISRRRSGSCTSMTASTS
jgi:hypothetical protein